MKDTLINFTIDDRFRNPFHWGEWRYEPSPKQLTALEEDIREYNRKVFGFIFYKTWNPFEDGNLIIIFLFFWKWKKKWIIRK